MTNSGATPKMKVHCRGGVLAAPTEKFHVNAKRSLAQMGVPKPELGDERVYGGQFAPCILIMPLGVNDGLFDDHRLHLRK